MRKRNAQSANLRIVLGVLEAICLYSVLSACAVKPVLSAQVQHTSFPQANNPIESATLLPAEQPAATLMQSEQPILLISTATPPGYTPLPTQPPVTLSPQAQAFAVTANNFRINEDSLDVEICIDLPDTQDWMIDRASIQAGGRQLSMNSSELLNYQPAGEDGIPGHRCDSFTFAMPVDIDLSDATLTVQSIAAQPREGQICTFLLGKVQKILDERQSGIKIECTEQPGYADAHVVARPESMSQSEAEAIAFSREYYTVEGPWTFTETNIPTATPYPTVALSDSTASPYAILRTLNQKADARLAYPGWVYSREDWQHDIDSDSYTTLPDGTAIPKAYLRETWYQLNETGRVVQSISQTHNTNGNLIQTEFYTKGVTWNSTVPEYLPQQPYKLHLNESYTGSLQANLKAGHGAAGQIELDGMPAIQFTLNEDFQVPDPQFYNQPITSDVVTAVFDMDSGYLKLVQTVVSLEDGSQRKLEQMRFLLISGIEPPPAIMALLVNALNP